MADELSYLGPRDQGRIALEQPREVRYWTRALGVTESQLRAAVLAAGDATQAVRQQLQSGTAGASQQQMRTPVSVQQQMG